MKRLLFCLFILTGCGSDEAPIVYVEEFNQSCTKQKLSSEYLVKFSDQTHQKIFASSERDLYKKINLLKTTSEKFNSILEIDYNFKVSQAEELQNHTENKDVNYSVNKGPESINAPYLWDQGYFGEGVRIALIDSGFDFDHPLLADSVLINENENGNDEDQNKLVGDIFGWDFINNLPLNGDLGSHGTIVGGVIAAKHTLNEKFSIAPLSKLIPVAALQPGSGVETDSSGDSNSILSALDYAEQRQAQIINASWAGLNCSAFIREKVRTLTDKGIFFITASGNEGLNIDETPSFPTSFPFSLVLGVGASGDDGQPLESSNYGSAVDFLTLGHKIYSTSPNQGYIRASGTSVATPLISGAVALLKEAFPKHTAQDLIKALSESSNQNKIPDLEKASLLLKN